MVRRCGFCREEGHDRRRCAGWIRHEEDRIAFFARNTIPVINQTVIDLSDDFAGIFDDSPPGSPPLGPPNSTRNSLRIAMQPLPPSPPRTPPSSPPRMRYNTPPNAPPRIEAHARPGHRPISFPNTGGQGRVGPIIHIRAVGTNLGNRFEEVADTIANTLVGMHTNTQSSRELVKLSNKVIEATSCAICIEELGETNKLVTRCGHQFCCGCMFIHMRANNFCPTCRGILA